LGITEKVFGWNDCFVVRCKMQAREKIVELLNGAAASITMLDVHDVSGVEEVQKTVDQIRSLAAGMEDTAAEARAAIGDAASKAIQVLQNVTAAGKDAAAVSIDSVTKAIMEMQEMVDHALQPPQIAPAAAPEAKPATLISEEDLPLVMDFVTEAAEHVETGEKALLAIEKNPGDKEAINQVFRSFHTIKGMAGFLNLTTIGSLAHAAENVLDMARKDKLSLTGSVADTILDAVDMMKKMIDELRSAAESQRPMAPQDGLDIMLRRLKDIVEGLSQAAAQPAPATPATAAPAAATAAPAAPMAEPAKCEAQTENAATVTPPAPAETTAPSASAAPAAATATARTAAATDEKIKVSTERLDLLINMVGELVTAQLMIADTVNSGNNGVDLGRKVGHQGKIVRELQELSMSMRMVPISGVFQKMSRLVRDLSHKAGKSVELVTIGEDTELDRSIVDNVSDPLVHMIRNSLDHGLEMPEERAKVGKVATGKVELRAFHQSGNIVIEIEDDGRGLNKDKILKKAIDNGIVQPGQELSEDEIFKLIFHAGLSTAEKITSVSGRGVGMDVVKKNVEALRGKVDIRSQLGKGTVFTIRLPLTLAVIDGQVVKVGSERYIVPLTSIVQSLRPEAKNISTVEGKGELALIRGELMPLIRLHQLFDVPDAQTDPAKALMMIVEEDGRKCGILVDDLLGQQQVVIKNLGGMLGRIAGVSGGAIMGDGHVCLILDVAGLMEASRKK
jgi:two-component system, chemotaxis family, sensor kinase CheA